MKSDKRTDSVSIRDFKNKSERIPRPLGYLFKKLSLAYEYLSTRYGCAF